MQNNKLIKWYNKININYKGDLKKWRNINIYFQ